MTGGGGDGKEKVSVANVALNMSNAIIGAGIVGLPYALKEAGCKPGESILHNFSDHRGPVERIVEQARRRQRELCERAECAL